MREDKRSSIGGRCCGASVVLAAVLLTAATAYSQRVAAPRASPPIRYEEIKSSSGEITVRLVVFDSSQYSLRVIDNGTRVDRPKFSSLADAMQQKGCVAGTNGGFFDLQPFMPSGLMVAEGKTISAFDPKGWQEGVFLVRGGEISLVERDDFATGDGLTAGLQSGPWLIRSGKPGTIEKTDLRRARRTFVAVGGSNRCAIGISTPATFYELAGLLMSDSAATVIEVKDALALDGGTSTGFWCDVRGANVSDPEVATVRNFVGLVPVGVQAPTRGIELVYLISAALVVGVFGIAVFVLKKGRR